MDFCQLGLAVVETEAQAIQDLKTRIDSQFNHACNLLIQCKGRVVVTGMGKSGHIGKKIAATFASTGTPAFFMHPGEASHGDLGMITPHDIVIAISYSGVTQELIILLPLLKRLRVPLITLTSDKNSTLAMAADANLNIHVTQEACPLGLAPTASTTATLVMGDAIAIALLQAKGFTARDFAFSHPGGILGKRLLLLVDELYHTGEDLPICHENTTVSDALIEVTHKKLGMTCVIDDQKKLVGVFTDGDIRRTLLKKQHNIHDTTLKSVMTKQPQTIQRGLLAVEALNIMQTFSITSLIVINTEQHPIAVLHIHDLLRAGVY